MSPQSPATNPGRPRRRPLFLVGGMLALIALTVWRFYIATPPPRLLNFGGQTMGTTFHVKVVADSRAQQSDRTRARLAAVIEQALDDVDTSMSTFRAQSEVQRFNRAPADAQFPLSDDTAAVVALALEVARLSAGAFDPTVGPLVDRWGFGPDRNDTGIPSEAELEALGARVGHTLVELDPAAKTLRKRVPDVHLDLSAVAKGFAVDKVSEALHTEGFDSFMVEVGGELRVSGSTELARPWRLAIERPDADARAIFAVLSIRDQAMATSGNYRNFTTIDGVRYSHTIDPRTGRPVTHDLASVTVLAPTCARADALATALSVLGPTHGVPWAEQHGVAALFIVTEDDTLSEISTSAFDTIRATS